MDDLISRKVLLDWINEQREEVTKKQVAGTDQSIFTREDLVAIQKCLSTFETKINNLPKAYDVAAVEEEIKMHSYFMGIRESMVETIVRIVRKGGRR